MLTQERKKKPGGVHLKNVKQKWTERGLIQKLENFERKQVPNSPTTTGTSQYQSFIVKTTLYAYNSWIPSE